MKNSEQIEVRALERGSLVTLDGQFIGGEETDAFRKVLSELAQEHETVVFVNMEGVTYVNSAFIGALISGNADVLRAGGTLVVAGLTSQIDSVFRLTKLHMVLPIYTRLDVAFAELGVSPT